MGSKLHVLAQIIAVAAFAHDAIAESAADLLKQAGEEYKNGKYNAAATLLRKAYDLEPKSETLFALAQAERLDGRCSAAVPLYRKLLAELKDLDVAKLVQNNLSLCKADPIPSEPSATPTATPSTPPKIVVRVEHRSDKVALSLFATGTLAIGAGVGLYISSRDNRDAAADARTLEDHKRFNDRANLQRGVALGAGALGIGLASYAVVRWMRGDESTASPTVSIAPGAASVGYVTTW